MSVSETWSADLDATESHASESTRPSFLVFAICAIAGINLSALMVAPGLGGEIFDGILG